MQYDAVITRGQPPQPALCADRPHDNESCCQRLWGGCRQIQGTFPIIICHPSFFSVRDMKLPDGEELQEVSAKLTLKLSGPHGRAAWRTRYWHSAPSSRNWCRISAYTAGGMPVSLADSRQNRHLLLPMLKD